MLEGDVSESYSSSSKSSNSVAVESGRGASDLLPKKDRLDDFCIISMLGREVKISVASISLTVLDHERWS